MHILELLPIAKTVWLERARRRPHTTLAWCVCAIVAATTGACALFGASPFAEPNVGGRLTRGVFVLGAGASLTVLCEWLIGVHLHVVAARSARAFWSWRSVGGTARRSPPRGYLALIVFTAVGAWAQPRMLGVLVCMLVAYGAGLVLVLRTLAFSHHRRKIAAKLKNESVASACDLVMVPLLAAAGFLLGNAPLLVVALIPPFVLLGLGGGRPRAASQLLRGEPAALASLARRLAPGVAALATDALLHGLAGTTLRDRAANADPYIAVTVATMLFTLAGLYAARGFVPDAARPAMALRVPEAWRPTALRAAAVSVGALALAVLVSQLLATLGAVAPSVAILCTALAGAMSFAALFVAMLANTEPYPVLCDPPAAITLPKA